MNSGGLRQVRVKTTQRQAYGYYGTMSCQIVEQSFPLARLIMCEWDLQVHVLMLKISKEELKKSVRSVHIYAYHLRDSACLLFKIF